MQSKTITQTHKV